MIEFWCPWTIAIEKYNGLKNVLAARLHLQGRLKVSVFFFFFWKPIRTLVGGRGPGEDQAKIIVAFIVVTQLTVHPLPPWMVKFFKRHHSVHLVSLTTHWLVLWGYTLNPTYIVLVSIWFGLSQQVLRNIKVYTI